jgi:hypothetical protein
MTQTGMPQAGTPPRDGTSRTGTADRWYEAAERPEIVEFGPVRGLAVSGLGEPGGAEYGGAVHGLFAVAGALLGVAAQAGQGFPMPPLEGRWWAEDDRPPLDVPRAEWRWHLFLRLPAGVESAGWVDRAREAARGRTPAVSRVQLVSFDEGRCVQMLHKGPYSDEPRSLALMDALIREEKLVVNGLHHEIYLTDPMGTDPAEARTILRQPVRPETAAPSQ